MENQNGRMYFRSDPVKYCHHPTREEKSSATEHCAHTRSSAAPTCIKQGQPPPRRRRTRALRVRRGCVAWWGTARQSGAAEARAGRSGRKACRGSSPVVKKSEKQGSSSLFPHSCKKSTNSRVSNWSKSMRSFWSKIRKDLKSLRRLMVGARRT